ncbi:MAG: GerMN domain-containing protein [Treponema sp.]|jgi:hypothetical protein|nr:GerMN domain-containing protein [Treponema sp.]
MSSENSDYRYVLGRFSIPKSGFFLLALLLLAAAVLIDFFTLGLARRTFMFYDIDSGVVIVENRLLPVSRENTQASYGSRRSPQELDITRYVEEALLGPVSSNAMPLFPRETRLHSLLYREGVVYMNLSEEAALPPPEGGEVFMNMKTLYAGVRRNFPFVRELRFFIAGRAAYAGPADAAEFRQFAGAVNRGVFGKPQKNVVKKRNSEI